VEERCWHNPPDAHRCTSRYKGLRPHGPRVHGDYALSCDAKGSPAAKDAVRNFLHRCAPREQKVRPRPGCVGVRVSDHLLENPGALDAKCCRLRYSARVSQSNPGRSPRIPPALLPQLLSPDYAKTPWVLAMAAPGQDPPFTGAAQAASRGVTGRHLQPTCRSPFSWNSSFSEPSKCDNPQ
jgi:hypothetical protein